MYLSPETSHISYADAYALCALLHHFDSLDFLQLVNLTSIVLLCSRGIFISKMGTAVGSICITSSSLNHIYILNLLSSVLRSHLTIFLNRFPTYFLFID